MQHQPMQTNKPAFSLIETCVTIALCALLIQITITSLGFLNQWIIRTELDKLHLICRFLQQTAVTSTRQEELVFDREHNAYHFKNHTEKLPQGVLFGILPNIKGPPSKATTIISSPITFEKNRIIFYPNGTLSAGTVYLRDSESRYLYALTSAVATVPFLRCYTYNHNWKLVS